jgi:hypothetical protein
MRFKEDFQPAPFLVILYPNQLKRTHWCRKTPPIACVIKPELKGSPATMSVHSTNAPALAMPWDGCIGDLNKNDDNVPAMPTDQPMPAMCTAPRIHLVLDVRFEFTSDAKNRYNANCSPNKTACKPVSRM